MNATTGPNRPGHRDDAVPIAEAGAPADATAGSGTSTAAGRARLLRHHWGRGPEVLAVPSALSAADAHRCAVTVGEPFRDGTQAHVLTRARFFTTAGRIVVPGRLLPEDTDDDHAHYRRRVNERLNGAGWLLTLENPFTHEYRWWSAVSAQLRSIWDEVGQPPLPVTAELTAGERYRRTTGFPGPPGSAVLLWVLDGSLDVELRREDEGERRPGADAPATEDRPHHRLRGVAGELLHWPAGYRSEELHGEGCRTLRVAVPAGARDAEELLREVLTWAAGERRPDEGTGGTVPFVHFPAAAADPVTVPEALTEAASLLHELAAGPDLERLLRHQWAARRSAGGLEPPPPPARDSPLDEDTPVRRIAEIIQLADGPGRSVWAVNGHLLPLGGGTPARLHHELATAQGPVTARELAQRLGAPAGSTAVLSLLRTLHRLRALTTDDQRGALR
ncbi:hypothetical protein [Streptomyces otsuchiensis]|uniref:hypothetical protein n=1 Tax=Streptomyces otsuchiensis TaxID=2681388 RepID=UPI00102FDF44|nr:hypothetical protein [Streptomyces otsuchiensis]